MTKWVVLTFFALGCEIAITTFLPECPSPIPVIDARNAGTAADTVGIVQGCPYISVDFNGDSTFVDIGRRDL